MAVHGVSVRQSSEFFDFGRELVWQLQLAVIEWNMYNEWLFSFIIRQTQR